MSNATRITAAASVLVLGAIVATSWPSEAARVHVTQKTGALTLGEKERADLAAWVNAAWQRPRTSDDAQWVKCYPVRDANAYRCDAAARRRYNAEGFAHVEALGLIVGDGAIEDVGGGYYLATETLGGLVLKGKSAQGLDALASRIAGVPLGTLQRAFFRRSGETMVAELEYGDSAKALDAVECLTEDRCERSKPGR